MPASAQNLAYTHQRHGGLIASNEQPNILRIINVTSWQIGGYKSVYSLGERAKLASNVPTGVQNTRSY